jgi:protein-arginine kinase activator protein McsA
MYGRITLDTEKGLDGCAWPGGYPIVYYTDDATTLCAECATKQEIANQDEEWIIHGHLIDGADVLEGSAIDHGIVTCEECGREIIGLEDSEYVCATCGTVNDSIDGPCRMCAVVRRGG